jgi:nucleotide-binding universal stress UspA family protein
MFQHILVAVDGTSTSTGALEIATALANESKGTLHLLHVVDERLIPRRYAEGGAVAPHYIDEALTQLRMEAGRVLAEAQEAAAAKGAKVNALLSSEGYQGVAGAILRQARKVKADLIVLGTHGRRGLTRILMGSDAEAVLREASIPVLLVRASADSKASKRHPTSKRPKVQPSEEEAIRLSVVSPAS